MFHTLKFCLGKIAISWQSARFNFCLSKIRKLPFCLSKICKSLKFKILFRRFCLGKILPRACAHNAPARVYIHTILRVVVKEYMYIEIGVWGKNEKERHPKMPPFLCLLFKHLSGACQEPFGVNSIVGYHWLEPRYLKPPPIQVFPICDKVAPVYLV